MIIPDTQNTLALICNREAKINGITKDLVEKFQLTPTFVKKIKITTLSAQIKIIFDFLDMPKEDQRRLFPNSYIELAR